MIPPSRTVLIVEDDPMSLELMTDLLLAAGWRVRTVTNGEDAVAIASEVDPELVLLDIGLPGIDGYETLRTLRADLTLHAVTIIAVSAQAMQGDAERAVHAGFDGYITKPVDTRRLVPEIEALLARRR